VVLSSRRRHTRFSRDLSSDVCSSDLLWSFMGTWNELLGQLIYINTPEKYTIQLGLASFSNMTGETLWGPLMAASFLALIPVIIFLLFAQRYFTDGIKMSGVKG